MRKRGCQNQESTGRNSRLHQRKRNFQNNLPLFCPCNTGRLFKRRIHTLESGDHLHKHKREVVTDFHKYNAPHGVDINGHRLQMENAHQPFVDVAGAPVEHHIPCHSAEKRREHVRDIEQCPHQAFRRDIAAAEKPGIEHTHDGAEDCGKHGNFQGVPHGFQIFLFRDLLDKHVHLELALVEEGIVDDHHNRDDHDNQKQDKADYRHHFVHIQTLMPVNRGQLSAHATVLFHAVAPPFCAG